MANIVSYINRYGDLSFDEKPYNIIDSAILATLSYIDLSGIIKDKSTIGKLGDKFFRNATKKSIKHNIAGIKSAIKIFDYIRDEKRYKDLVVYNYEYISNEKQQIGCMCIDIDDNTTYISYEGTDELVIGWKEDFELCYKFPIESHKTAINYANKNIKLFTKKKYILGGHSKGGNMALVAGMKMNPFKRLHVKNVYSFDGPGLRDKEFKSLSYKHVLPKYELVVSDQSIVGLLLFEKTDPLVVKANKKGLFAHDMLTWELHEDEFVKSKLSRFSNNMNVRLYDWLERYSYQERKVFVNELFNVLDRAGIKSLLDIKDSKLKSIVSIIKATKDMNSETKKMVKEMIMFIVNLY